MLQKPLHPTRANTQFGEPRATCVPRRHGARNPFPLWKVQGRATPQDCGGTLLDLGPLRFALRLSLEFTHLGVASCGAAPGPGRGGGLRAGLGHFLVKLLRAQPPESAAELYRRPQPELGAGGAGQRSEAAFPTQPRVGAPLPLARLGPPLPARRSLQRAQLVSNPELQFNSVRSGFVHKALPRTSAFSVDHK